MLYQYHFTHPFSALEPQLGLEKEHLRQQEASSSKGQTRNGYGMEYIESKIHIYIQTIQWQNRYIQFSGRRDTYVKFQLSYSNH